MIGKTIVDKYEAQAVLQEGDAVTAYLTNFSRDGVRLRRRSPHARSVKGPVPVIGLIDLIRATLGEYFDITITNPRAVRHWRLIRDSVRARPYALFWLLQTANRIEEGRIQVASSGNYLPEAMDICNSLSMR